MNNIGLKMSSGCVLNDLSSGLKIPGTPLISSHKTSVPNGTFLLIISRLPSTFVSRSSTIIKYP